MELRQTAQRFLLVNFASPNDMYIRSENQDAAFAKLSDSLRKMYDPSLCRSDFPRFPSVMQEAASGGPVWLYKGAELVAKRRCGYRRARLRADARMADGTPAETLLDLYFVDEGVVEKVRLEHCYQRRHPGAVEPPLPLVRRCHLANVHRECGRTDAVAGFVLRCLENSPRFFVIERGPPKSVDDDEASAPVEIVLDMLTSDTPFSEIKTASKYLSQMILEAKLCPYVNPLDVPWDLHVDEDEDRLPEDAKGDVALVPVTWPDPVYPSWKLGEPQSVVVGNVDLCGQIYVTQLTDLFLLERMEDFFELFYGKAEEPCPRSMGRDVWGVGDDCVVFCVRSGKWKRGRISRVNPSYESYEVLLVDHGIVLYNQGNCKITASHLRIPFHYGSEPMLALRLILPNVVPKYANSSGYMWPTFLGSFLLRLFRSEYGGSCEATVTKVECSGMFPIPCKVSGKLNLESFDASLYMTRNYPHDLQLGHLDVSLVQNDLDLEAFSIQASKVKKFPQKWVTFNDLTTFQQPVRPKNYFEEMRVTSVIKSKSICYVRFLHQIQAEARLHPRLKSEAPDWPPAPLVWRSMVAWNRPGTNDWFRGIILDVDNRSRQRTAQVYLIDTGEHLPDAEPTSLKLLSPTFLDIPILCFKLKNKIGGQILDALKINSKPKFLVGDVSFPSPYEVEFDDINVC